MIDQPGRFLNRNDPSPEPQKFEALGNVGSEHFIGLETFPNPGVRHVTMTSDEFTAVCPVTGQPDLYEIAIAYFPEDKCIESKSLKLFLGQFRNVGGFCEDLAVKIMQAVAEILEIEEEHVQVTIVQKARGGISIKAVA